MKIARSHSIMMPSPKIIQRGGPSLVFLMSFVRKYLAVARRHQTVVVNFGCLIQEPKRAMTVAQPSMPFVGDITVEFADKSSVPDVRRK